ncbi:MAG: ribose-5-phosphate isomerase RpiA [Methanobacteriota archaeon]
MTSKDDSKKTAAEYAIDYVEDGISVGLGTGSTVKYFIEALAREKLKVKCVPTSVETEKLAKKLKLNVVDLVEGLKPSKIGGPPLIDVTIDGADEVDKKFNLIKGGGGALTREKIVASASKQFIVVVDESKLVQKLGAFPLPIEVLSFAVPYVEFELRELGGNPVIRKGFTSDNGNPIIDVSGLDFPDPLQLETELNNIPGIVENGIFSVLQPEVVVVGKGKKAEVLENG